MTDEKTAPALSFDEVIEQRKSVRGFLPQAIPKELLHKIFALAQQAPSNCNIQRIRRHRCRHVRPNADAIDDGPRHQLLRPGQRQPLPGYYSPALRARRQPRRADRHLLWLRRQRRARQPHYRAPGQY